MELSLKDFGHLRWDAANFAQVNEAFAVVPLAWIKAMVGPGIQP